MTCPRPQPGRHGRISKCRWMPAGIPCDPFCQFLCFSCCAGATARGELPLGVGVSFSGSAWECTPFQLDNQYPTSDLGGPTPPTPCYKVEQTLQRSSAPAFPMEQVETGISPPKPQLYLASSLALSRPLLFTGLTCVHPLSKSQAHPASALLSGDSTQERSRGEMQTQRCSTLNSILGRAKEGREMRGDFESHNVLPALPCPAVAVPCFLGVSSMVGTEEISVPIVPHPLQLWSLTACSIPI